MQENEISVFRHSIWPLKKIAFEIVYEFIPKGLFSFLFSFFFFFFLFSYFILFCFTLFYFIFFPFIDHLFYERISKICVADITLDSQKQTNTNMNNIFEIMKSSALAEGTKIVVSKCMQTSFNYADFLCLLKAKVRKKADTTYIPKINTHTHTHTHTQM
jgi:hypothetical protein